MAFPSKAEHTGNCRGAPMKGIVCFAAALALCANANAAPRKGLLRVLSAPARARKVFLLAATAQTAAMVADVETTEAGVRQQQFSEGNPLFGARPGRAKLYSILGGINVAELFAEHHLKAASDKDPQEGRWKWWTVAGAATGFHATGAIHNGVLLSRY
jgi:hypothetical protein